MAEYSVVRVKDVPDQAENLGHDPEQFEVRFMRNDLGCEHCGVSYIRFSPGFTPAGHRHKRQEEIYVLVSGRAEANVGDELVELEPWMALRVPPETPRALRAVGTEDAVVIAVGAPNTGPGDGLPPPDDFDKGWND
jgi:mannose-6-phosphate isomerase-like protein (cupin superfamily)